MYPSFFGLSESPFELTYNPKFVFYTARHREARSYLEHGLLAGTPLTVVLGEPGTGKTTLLQTSLRSDRCRHVHCVYLTGDTAMREPLISTLLAELSPAAATATAPSLPALRTILGERRSRAKISKPADPAGRSVSPRRQRGRLFTRAVP